MKSNAGLTDRVIRLYLGIIIAGIGIYFNSAWALLGVPVFISGVAGYCVFYPLLKVNTLEK
jgi:hypothetical protein